MISAINNEMTQILLRTIKSLSKASDLFSKGQMDQARAVKMASIVYILDSTLFVIKTFEYRVKNITYFADSTGHEIQNTPLL